MQKRSSIVLAAAALALLLSGTAMLSQSEEFLLVRIERKQPASMDAELLAAIKVVQNLRTCIIAEIPAGLETALRDGGIRFEVLDTDPGEKPYYLVYAHDDRESQIPADAGNVRPVEEGILLFWTDSEDVREIVPPTFHIKRLPPPTDLPIEIEPTGGAGSQIRREQQLDKTPNPDIVRMVQEVSQSALNIHVIKLQNFGTRYATTDGCISAGAYIYDYFTGLGLQTEYDPFSFGSGHTSQNVVASIPGKVSPQSVVIVCAHYDSASSTPRVAPGADDNASGTAAVLELARVMRDYSFNFTLKFIAFSAEEWGLWGSSHYAQRAKLDGEKIVAVINLDMIGYADSVPEDLDIVANPASAWLADRLSECSRMYSPMGVATYIDESITSSDHSAFWDQGYSALLAIEDAPPSNPYYHKATDTFDTLNPEFLFAATRVFASTAADVAQPHSGVSAPTALRASTQVHRSLFTRLKSVSLTWDASTSTVIRYNVYRSTTSQGNYTVIGSPGNTLSYLDRFLDAGTAFFYVVTAVDSAGRESNYSTEANSDAANTR